jgi:hypothetical protein
MEAKLHLYIGGIAEARLGNTPLLPRIVLGQGNVEAKLDAALLPSRGKEVGNGQASP